MTDPLKKIFFLYGLILLTGMVGAAPAPVEKSRLTMTPGQYLEIGRRIWKNECGGTFDGLTTWNAGEGFISLGIGHFIWYPKDREFAFEESFPAFVQFARDRGAVIPAWILKTPDCPWDSREEFRKAFHQKPMTELRDFLSRNVPLQAEFIARRLEQALPKMLATLPVPDRKPIAEKFYLVASTPVGLYALMDYVNFKGEGIKETERYQGQGWGLLQVLQEMTMPVEGREAAREFSRAAGAVLVRRIENSPVERGEKRWRDGWLNRTATYRP
ncbi:MAG: hypothetical protein SFY92_03155 [Verrucomicrobiae bacterium]|nr:hypothetical protein [Verrucomicrobiae bacterium]